MTAAPVTAAIPRPTMILRLVAGRGAFRIGVQVMAVALVAVWGADAFGHYANALGLFAWLPLAIAAPEKTALKVLPRTRLLTPALARMTLALSAAPVLALLAVLVPVALAAPTSVLTTYLAAASWMALSGLLTTVSGLHRLRGRPGLDAVAFGASAGIVLAATAITSLVAWTPQFHLLLLVTGTAVVTGCALAALPRDWLRPVARWRHSLLRRLVRTTVMLGVSDVVDTLGTATLYLVLALSGRVTDSGPLYLALLGCTMVCQLVFYLLRVGQPTTSARLRGTGGTAGRIRASWLLKVAERYGLICGAAFALLALVPSVRDLVLGDGVALPVALGVVAFLEVGLFVVVTYATYLLENTNDSILVVTASSAMLGLVAVVVLAVTLVPLLGAVGGLVVLVLALAVKAFTMRRMLLRTRPELHAGPDPRSVP